MVFLDEAIDFVSELDHKIRIKIYFNLDKVKLGLDPKLLKKVSGEIWEFRLKYAKEQFRILTFWDKSEKSNTLLVCTHGFVKKTKKLSKKEIQKAEDIRKKYWISKA